MLLSLKMHPFLGALLTGGMLYGAALLYTIYRYLFKRSGLKYKGKHVFITGGSTGLGLSIATKLFRKGAKVTIIARNEDKLKKAAETISKKGDGRVQYFTFDCSNPDVNEVEKLLDKAEGEFGHIQYLFCTAGFSLPNMFLEADQTFFERQINTNYLGYVKMSQPVAKRMAERNRNNKGSKLGDSGTIVYTSSILGVLTCVGYSPYSPTKSAIKALADIVRIEMAPHNVGVHLFLPGSILSPGYEEENKYKPEVTKKIEGSADFLAPEKCADILLSGMGRGDYIVTTEMLFEFINPTSIGS
mmetsp:Transcript_8742/g.8293  ORF Transcript_8742/g.8293 Transcript_8742/m.8293 type:complete len:301 (+) Transcript_8742:1-903(+)